MRIIINKLGKLSSIDLSFVQTRDALDYIKSMQKNINTHTNNYLDLVPRLSESFKQMMMSMLEFNPYFRSSARELLKHPVFDDIRIFDNEK